MNTVPPQCMQHIFNSVKSRLQIKNKFIEKVFDKKS